MIKKFAPCISLLLLLLFCFFIYSFGLKGDFLFDDYPNLEDLGAYGAIDSWQKAYNFINSGFAGPTGRPVSLATFLLDANTWPTSPYPFKYTNIMLHLLNGVMLCWTFILLLRHYSYKEEKVLWIALLATAFWLLHPYFVSTTLYIVQRMAQLATLFTLIGFIGYLKFRTYLTVKPYISYMGMAIVIGICTILATFSKENGALLPLLILVIEFCNPNRTNRLIWQWKTICLYIPSLVVLYFIFKGFTLETNPWPNRNFNMVERLYSEARITTEYLYNLYIPQIELRGLYQDGYNVSKSLLDPITTLFSLIFLIILFLSSIILKNKYTLYSLAILFFFVAHLMESTVIGLELYFEHRNYLAALFLFLPLASGLYSLKEKIEDKTFYLLIALIFGVLSFFTYERVKLWADNDRLQIYWAESSPDSPRAQTAIAAILFESGQIQEANEYLEKSSERLPHSALLKMRLLLQKIYSQTATHEDFVKTAQELERQQFDAQAIQALRNLTEYIVEQHLVDQYGESIFYLINHLENDKNYANYPVFKRLVSYLKAKLYLEKGDDKNYMYYYVEAIKFYGDVESGLMMVAEVGSKGFTKNALILLNYVEEIYQKQSVVSLRRSKAEYDFEIKRLRELLLKRDEYKD